jgi:hypothetical protein
VNSTRETEIEIQMRLTITRPLAIIQHVVRGEPQVTPRRTGLADGTVDRSPVNPKESRLSNASPVLTDGVSPMAQRRVGRPSECDSGIDAVRGRVAKKLTHVHQHSRKGNLLKSVTFDRLLTDDGQELKTWRAAFDTVTTGHIYRVDFGPLSKQLISLEDAGVAHHEKQVRNPAIGQLALKPLPYSPSRET